MLEKLTDKALDLRSVTQPAYAAVVLVLSLTIYYVFIEPRPYYIAPSDADHDYFYNGQLILDTGFPSKPWHPGIPGFYLSALIGGMARIFGGGPQFVMNTGYLVLGMVTAASFGYFFKVLQDHVSRLALWASFVILLTWPTVVFFLNSFVSDLFAISLTVAGVGYFWRHWIIDPSPSHRRAVILASVFGVALAFKLTVLPVIAATWLVFGLSTFQQYWSTRHRINTRHVFRLFNPFGTRAVPALVGPLVTAAIFLVLVFPVWGAAPMVLRSLVLRVGTSTWLGPTEGSLGDFVLWYMNNTPSIMLIVFSSLLIAFIGAFTYVRSNPKTRFRFRVRSELFQGGIYAGILVGLFVHGITTLVGGGLTTSTSEQSLFSFFPTWNLGLGLRQLGVSFVGLVVLTLFGAMMVKESKVDLRPYLLFPKFVRVVVPVLCIVFAVWTIAGLTSVRSNHLHGWQNELIPAMQELAAYEPDMGRVAFGTSHNGFPGLFEYYGDANYGDGRHAEEISQNRSDIAIFDIKIAAYRFKNPDRIIPSEKRVYRAALIGLAERIYFESPKYLPPFRDLIGIQADLDADDLIIGSPTNASVGRVAYLTETREQLHLSREEMIKLLVQEFGSGFLRTEIMYGHQWEIFDRVR